LNEYLSTTLSCFPSFPPNTNSLNRFFYDVEKEELVFVDIKLLTDLLRGFPGATYKNAF
jgi:hypothetical protein